ncbi:MAG: hypothetical protein ACSLEM_06730 [Candidatus Malihini olakiniferum]
MQIFAQSWQQRWKEKLLLPDSEQIFTLQTTLQVTVKKASWRPMRHEAARFTSAWANVPLSTQVW